jgi:butyryl-CoA:acetate CoA-transferase
MDFEKIYREKLTTAAEAVKIVKSGDYVEYGFCAITPYELDRAMEERLKGLENVQIHGGVLLRQPAIFEMDDPGAHFTWNSWHMSGIERRMIKKGNAFYAPMRYSELPRYYRDGNSRVDVAMFIVSEMDRHGRFHFGLSASHMAAICEKAEHIIVEVNPNMPRCLGDGEASIHVSDVSMIVESDEPIPELLDGKISEIDQKVAELILPCIPNGACLQLGIGGMPNAVGTMIAQSDLKDLGVHSEMYVNAFLKMAKAGKINGKKKNIGRYQQNYAFAAGSRELYDYLNDNPECVAAPANYMNDIRVVAQLDNFISINNAVNLDLFGQINAESAGISHISGTGGQLDFMLGAYLSKGGKSFICCASTYTDKQGQLQSRILPTLAKGTIVTDSRTCPQYIATEYGMINLKGASVWERAERLISIAHPMFRDELIKEAEKMHIWNCTNRIAV